MLPSTDEPRREDPASPPPHPLVGWREWVGLPDLGIPRIKAKVDTGARSSALHAFDLERFERDGASWVRFSIHPLQRNSEHVTPAEARLLDERWVRSSSGRATLRPLIETTVEIGANRWLIELTLVRRDLMGFRMLLGRQAIRGRLLVDPGRSYLAGRRPKRRSTRRRRETPATPITLEHR